MLRYFSTSEDAVVAHIRPDIAFTELIFQHAACTELISQHVAFTELISQHVAFTELISQHK